MTEKLYLRDSYETEFSADIVKKIDFKGRTGLILNRTYFYPESGGQLCDKGRINNSSVIEVFEDGNNIIHLIDSDIHTEKVNGRIDWNYRFNNMQQHTGQHILSQSFIRLFNASTISSTLGKNVCTIDILKENLSLDEVTEVENVANRIVYENRAVRIHFPEPGELDKFPLRKLPPEGKKPRIIEVESFDFSPCGGTHCKSTGEVGIIKIKKWERYKGNIRVEFLCGLKALRDFQQKNIIVNKLMEKLSGRENEIINRTEKIIEDNKVLRKRNNNLLNKILEQEVKELLSMGDIKRGRKIIRKVFIDRDINEIKNIAIKIKSYENCISILGIKGEKGHIIFSCSENLNLDMNELIRRVFAEIKGKGGGTKFFAQGGCSSNDVELALELVERFL
ncbi:metal-dependent hydrolase [candidate division KSB1 bacterium]|nr:MAG: metal-dependent hydrolase [candidate division KSB1 bacterium]